MLEALEILTTATFWAAALRIATPYILGTLGELVCERAGVLNLGIEGIFTAGAMSGWMAVYFGADLWTGVLVAALVGAAFGLLHALFTVPLGLSQHVTGLGVTLLATSASYFTYRIVLPNVSTPPRIAPFAPIVPGLSDLPLIGPLFPADAADLSRDRADRSGGLRPRAHAARPRRPGRWREPDGGGSAGLDVYALRIGAVMAGSALMAVGGAFLTLSAFNAFFEMVAGRGWICIALVVFASWNPWKALFGALLFGAFDAFQVRLQQIAGTVVPHCPVFLMLPYAFSIAALVVMSRRAAYPNALMIPHA